jgi:two-component system copper resistance phosphate regulon response regulator CusR
MELMRLLLVEDDRDLSDFVREGMAREGFVVDVVGDGERALEQAEVADYDVILLDIMIPKQDGFSVLKNLRGKGYKGAVLLVTSQGQERDKLKGFGMGADDYIVKPFLLSELIARVRAILRRTSGSSSHAVKGAALKAGTLQMDLLKHEVKKGGKAITLTKKEFGLLECFMRRPGQVLSQAVLSQQLSNADFNSHTNLIEVHIKNLRSKIDSKSGPSLIRTVRGCGYVLDV